MPKIKIGLSDQDKLNMKNEIENAVRNDINNEFKTYIDSEIDEKTAELKKIVDDALSEGIPSSLYEHNFDIFDLSLGTSGGNAHLYFSFINKKDNAYLLQEGELFVTEIINRKIKKCSGYVTTSNEKELPIVYMEGIEDELHYKIKIYYIEDNVLKNASMIFGSNTTIASYQFSDTVTPL